MATAPSPPATDAKSAGSRADLPGNRFVHLHLHTEYSLLDGGNRIDRLVKRVKELGMPAVGVTDHGNIFGAVAFYLAAKEAGVKPILGVEAYVTPPGKPRTDRTYSGGGEGGYHLVLLAENNTGWQNLLVLCSEAFLTGFYYKPRIDRELLARHSEGLIAINGHLGSEIGEHLLAYERSGDQKHWDAAVESARWHAATFGDAGTKASRHQGTKGPDSMPGCLDASMPSFFIELQHHVPEQNSINPWLIKLARELGLPLVADNDAHFLRAEDHDAHDTLICISTGKAKSDPDRMRYTPELYVKSPAEMRALFAQYGDQPGDAGREALDNTVRIAERCSVDLPLGKSHAPMVRVARRGTEASRHQGTESWTDLPRWDEPRFAGDLSAWYQAYCAEFEVVPLRLPEGLADDQRQAAIAEARAECDAALRRLAEAGFVWRYGPEGTEARRHAGTQGSDSAPGCLDASVPADRAEKLARLERELKILADKNISAYFLIVWDFVSWGRAHGVPGLARGSGVGTMVGYALGLSNACPVRYGLLFERFTDPDRSEYPDVDIDLCQDGRQRVIDHVRGKYGHVAQIITFGTLKARAAIRDAGRVMEMTPGEVDQIAKLVPETLNITLEEAMDAEPELRKLYERDERVRRVIDSALRLEGQVRHAGVHAAGVIVATRPLHEVVPLYKQSGAAEHEVVTQWDGPTCEKMGLLKMDFLGLRTITIVERCKKLIREGLSERDIWAAVGRLEEYQKWQSGQVAQWQSGDVDGRQAAHQDVHGSDRLAAGHGPGPRDLRRDAAHAQGGALRAHQPDAPGDMLGPDEHRRGLRKAQSPGVHPWPADRDGLADGAGHGVPDRNLAAHDQGVVPGAGALGRGGSPAERADPEARGQEHERPANPSASDLGHSATPPLRHSATSPSSFARPPHPLDLDRLSYADPNVFALFQRGETTGVFQFESPGMRRLLVEMKPDRLEDLIAANALFRPGPMDLIPDYNRRKHGEAPVPKVHEIVDRFTSETYGVMVYQEQVMQIVHGLGGIKLRDAYTLIKNISKKKHDKIEKERPKFVDGAQKQGLSKKQAEDLFELILKFAGYGFNKSHSTGYAIVAYQTAYLKTYFPLQYMAAFLTYESQAQKAADWIPYLEDCKKTRVIDPATGATLKVGVEVKPPDVNLSQADFAVVFEDGGPASPTPSSASERPNHLRAHQGHIRFGLKAIKGAGEKAIDVILAERHRGIEASRHHAEPPAPSVPGCPDALVPFLSLFDFTERIAARAPGVLNKTTLESLVTSGAMDCLHGRAKRAAMLATIEQALAAGAKAAADKASGQGSLFGGGDARASGSSGKPRDSSPADAGAAASASIPLAPVNAWTEAETLEREKQVMGFYVSSHPMDGWKPWAACFVSASVAALQTAQQDQRVVLSGLIQSVRTMVVKQGRSAGQKMAAMQLEDPTGTCECVVFSDAYAKFGHLVEADKIVFVLGRIDLSRGTVQVIAERLVPIDGVPLLPGRVRVVVPGLRLNGTGMAAMERAATLLIDASPGFVCVPVLPEPKAPAGLGAPADLNAALDLPAGRMSMSAASPTPHAAGQGGPPTGSPTGAPGGRIGVVDPPVSTRSVPVAGVISGKGATIEPAFPVELVIETEAGRALMATDPRLKVRLTPTLVRELCRVLGENSVRVVGGITAEATEPKRGKPWERGRGGGD